MADCMRKGVDLIEEKNVMHAFSVQEGETQKNKHDRENIFRPTQAVHLSQLRNRLKFHTQSYIANITPPVQDSPNPSSASTVPPPAVIPNPTSTSITPLPAINSGSLFRVQEVNYIVHAAMMPELSSGATEMPPAQTLSESSGIKSQARIMNADSTPGPDLTCSQNTA